MTGVLSCGATAPGSRRLTASILDAEVEAERFAGLPDDLNHWQLLDLLRRARVKLGLDTRLFSHLEYLVRKTQPCDWEGGQKLVVWQSVTRTARELGVTTRTVRNIETRLNEAKWITWADSGNHRRGGSRDEDGYIEDAWGVDLRPLGARLDEIREAAKDAEKDGAAWVLEKKRWHSESRRVRRLLEILGRIDSPPAAAMVRIREKMELDDLRKAVEAITAARRKLEDEARALLDLDDGPEAVDPGVGETPPEDAADSPDPGRGPGADPGGRADVENPQETWGKTPGFSARSEPAGADIQYTKLVPESFGYMYGRQGESPPGRRYVDCGLGHIRSESLQEVACETVGNLLPDHRPADWDDVAWAGRKLREDLGISRELWGRGVRLIGPRAMAVLLIVTCCRHESYAEYGGFDRRVRNPGGFVRGCLGRAEKGELHLHSSVFGLVGVRAAEVV